METAREKVAAVFGAAPGEIFFTSGGSEADNWAIKGTAYALMKKGKKHIISTAFEHHAVLHTLKFLENAGLPVTAVSDVTGFPEILGGRVKTLHPHIHGGILADKDNPEHLAVLKEKGIKAFDLICVNLYDFESALAKGLKPREAIEEIDIGGPCMLRAASKNFHSILVLSDPDTYAEATAELKANDMSVSLPFRQRMAARTFAKTSRYDAMIAEYLTKN